MCASPNRRRCVVPFDSFPARHRPPRQADKSAIHITLQPPHICADECTARCNLNLCKCYSASIQPKRLVCAIVSCDRANGLARVQTKRETTSKSRYGKALELRWGVAISHMPTTKKKRSSNSQPLKRFGANVAMCRIKIFTRMALFMCAPLRFAHRHSTHTHISTSSVGWNMAGYYIYYTSSIYICTQCVWVSPKMFKIS